MFYLEGEYHLFYQYHPGSTVWGPMHWGHAISKDLVTWETMPVALSPDDKGMIFSGSAVVDWNNTSGFGSSENPPIVAMFTYHDQSLAAEGVLTHQTQAIAYSSDKGRTWVKYEDNPVIDNPGIADFRDPKVVWDEEHEQWVMALAQKDHVGFYVSQNLKEWSHVSDFGANFGAHGGVWECPDLLRIRVEGTDQYNYVLLVSLNPGGPNGGSATQYFIGDWDGQRFTLDPQQEEFLRVKPAVFPKGSLFEGFENDFAKWTVSGEAFSNGPTKGHHPKQWPISGFKGEYLANSFRDGDRSQGQLRSYPFKITHSYINFHVAGGYEPHRVAVQLVINGQVVRSSGGSNTNNFIMSSWSVAEFVGQQAQINIIDISEDPWGFIMVDHIVQSDKPAKNAQETALWMDWGTDNYAGVTFSNTADVSENPILMGWMSNWDYARVIPTGQWRGAMTLPRTLGLVNTSAGLRLTSTPHTKVKKLLSDWSRVRIKPKRTESINLPSQGVVKVSIEFAKNRREPFRLELHNRSDKVVIDINLEGNLLTLDRRMSGKTDFDESFGSVQTMPILSSSQPGILEFWLDTSSIEVFMGKGEGVLTARIFPEHPLTNLSVQNSGIAPNSSLYITVERVGSIW